MSSMPAGVMRDALRGARAIRSCKARLAWPSAQASRASPPATINPITLAVSASPNTTAAKMAARAMTSTPSWPPISERSTSNPTCAVITRAAPDHTQTARSAWLVR